MAYDPYSLEQSKVGRVIDVGSQTPEQIRQQAEINAQKNSPSAQTPSPSQQQIDPSKGTNSAQDAKAGAVKNQASVKELNDQMQVGKASSNPNWWMGKTKEQMQKENLDDYKTRTFDYDVSGKAIGSMVLSESHRLGGAKAGKDAISALEQQMRVGEADDNENWWYGKTQEQLKEASPAGYEMTNFDYNLRGEAVGARKKGEQIQKPFSGKSRPFYGGGGGFPKISVIMGEAKSI